MAEIDNIYPCYTYSGHVLLQTSTSDVIIYWYLIIGLVIYLLITYLHLEH